MKAINLRTNELVTVVSNIEQNQMNVIDSKGICSLVYASEFMFPKNFNGNIHSGINWEQRRYELAKAAMQGFCANSHDSIAIAADSKTVTEWSVGFANAMIEKLKGG